MMLTNDPTLLALQKEAAAWHLTSEVLIERVTPTVQGNRDVDIRTEIYRGVCGLVRSGQGKEVQILELPLEAPVRIQPGDVITIDGEGVWVAEDFTPITPNAALLKVPMSRRKEEPRGR